ncbi:MAG: omptin family outer membrane protease [Treponema sp.]|nr:omptin family outer membrane protease [Treponema sp.]
MKTVFAVLFLPLLFFSTPPKSSGLEIDFIFHTGVRFGLTQELVYEGNNRISQLDWTDLTVPNIGFTVHAGARNFFFRAGLVSAIPAVSGEMENFDFLIPGSQEVSHYSWHENNLDKDFTLSFEAGYEFRFGIWRVTPSAGFQFRNRKWTASGGFLQYPVMGPWTGEEPKVRLNGPVISYEQAMWFPFVSLGIGFDHTFPHEGRWRVSIVGSIFPYIWAEANDIHFLRNMQFYDSMRGGIGYSFTLRYEFYPQRANGIGFITDFIHGERITNVRGTTSSNTTGISSGPPIISEGFSAGTEIAQWHVSFSVVIPLFRR